ncbi:hypothetical protein B9Z55_008156 [Caenorhabditis nigoni]|uniref:CX domain-containing protein n=1 Tax=Caenorhabditis nigoni TaxID=1611254 RepID=A0A2G5VCY1_9PELO|nr:hypothetical protein B9Z55_008156 [Caenorhabditis nigoni]
MPSISAETAEVVIESQWMRASEADNDAMIKKFKDGESHTVGHIHQTCEPYTGTKFYREGNTTSIAHKICCELVDYCSFYKQTWFYLACGGGVLLIIIIVGVIISVCCCCKKRGGGGKDLEISESCEESTKDEEQETD